ncbi:AMP-binding protein [Streptomyces sp. NPDC006372]|uniref:AMP-binding protein n=1 Tax=Streptomyces sp. NPDC006372 TaxID=3155599 RepID=UPI0033BC21A4
MNQTLIEHLESRAHSLRDPELTFVDEGRKLTLTGLLREAHDTARGLTALGVRPGHRVAFVMPNESSFLVMLFAAQYAHATPVPLAPPFGAGSMPEYVRHVAGILADGNIGLLVVDSALPTLQDALTAALPDAVVLSQAAIPGADEELPAGRPDFEHPAFIQYTSGSTSAPKGVTLTHGNLVAGLRAIAEPSAVTPQDKWGIWAPLFHDMGIFAFLTALSAGCDVVLWHPRTFVRDPLGWLGRFADEGCTLSPAPNFALDVMVAAAKAKGLPDGLDLSRWRLLYNGGEPVNAHSVEEFQQTFGPVGFRPETMRPVLGMAEATLLVTFPPLGRAPLVRWADRKALLDGAFVPAPAHEDGSRALVSVGLAVPGVEIRISADGRAAPEGRVGEIELSGAVVTRGYFGRPVGDERTHDGWLRTGDLGVIIDGELYMVGRAKDLITVRGLNYYAEDVEAVIRDLPGLSRKRCVAIPDDERMLVVAETALEDPAERAALLDEIRNRIQTRIGLPDTKVRLAPPRFLPLTSSGKVQRRRLRSLFGELAGSPAGS